MDCSTRFREVANEVICLDRWEVYEARGGQTTSQRCLISTDVVVNDEGTRFEQVDAPPLRKLRRYSG